MVCMNLQGGVGRERDASVMVCTAGDVSTVKMGITDGEMQKGNGDTL